MAETCCSILEETQRGMIHIYTGEGKGKTTAALGLALRAAGSGKQVVILQFLKGRHTSELNSLALIPGITVLRNDKQYPFFKFMTPEHKTSITAEQNALFQQAMDLVQAGKCDVLILDEVMAAYQHHTIDKAFIHNLLEEKPYALELVMTGRNARDYFIEKADYVTEMLKKKHPYDEGYEARKGIEY